jgi:AraC-like DNA-binding protein
VPKPIDRPLFLLSRSEELETNLRRIVNPPFRIQRLRDWAELKEALTLAPQTAICFADALSSVGSERGLSEGLREVSRKHPLVAVVACAQVTECPMDVLDTLRKWDVAEILDLEKELSPAGVSRRLDLVKTVWAHRLFSRALPRTLTARGRTILEAVAEVAAGGGYVTELADELGISRGTVTRWSAAAGVPEPRRMFAWTRLLLAADLLECHDHSIETVARLSGFTSAASLKSTSKTFTALSPSELRESGPFETTASLAREEFRAAREAARRSRQHTNSWYN